MQDVFVRACLPDASTPVIVHAYTQAIEDYTQALQLDPGLLTARNNRAACHIKLGQWKEAVEDCNAVLAVEAENAKALLRRAAARCGGGRFSCARGVLCVVYHGHLGVSSALYFAITQQAAPGARCEGGFGVGVAHPAW